MFPNVNTILMLPMVLGHCFFWLKIIYAIEFHFANSAIAICYLCFIENRRAKEDMSFPFLKGIGNEMDPIFVAMHGHGHTLKTSFLFSDAPPSRKKIV